MAELQRLIDEIRFQLQSQDCEVTDTLMQLAADYAAVSREVNLRLRRCREFLKQELRSEAIHLAEVAPKLLDVVATVDFPERGAWESVVSLNRLQRPEPLLLDVAEQLNEAYAIQQPFERLLDKHRLLALGRAPLNERITVLRQLAKVDGASAVWDDDVRSFERARAGQIETQATSAAMAGDREALKKLSAELAHGEWREPVAKTLGANMQRLANEVIQRSARSELQEIESELNAAFAIRDLAKCRTIRQRGTDLAAQVGLENGDRLFDHRSPALDWLSALDAKERKEHAFRRAVSALERELADQYADAEDLRKAAYSVEKCERGLPEPLGSRYRDRVRALENADERHHRLVVGTAVVGLLFVIGVFAMVVYYSL